MKRQVADIITVAVLIFIIAAYFIRLFYPSPALIVTPDFGKSDAFHRSFATKYLLWERVRQGSPALWTSYVNGGYPILGDSVGAVFPPAILLFAVFDAVNGYNALLVLSVIAFGTGWYVWLRRIGIRRMPSFFAGVSLSLSGMIIPRLVHGMVIPSLALLPWVMLATYNFAQSQTRVRFVWLTFVIGLQLLANFPQASFITLFFAYSYLLFLSPKRWLPLTVSFAAAVLVACGIAAVQLLPAWEYYRQSTARSGFGYGTASLYAFRLADLGGFLDPYRLGNPKYGQYPPFWQSQGDIFWENSVFVGFLPILLVGMGIIRNVIGSHGRWDKQTVFFLGAVVVSLLLMLGPASPLYFLYTIPPFSMFRTPSRFTWILLPSVITLAALELNTWWIRSKRPAVKAFLLSLILANILHVWLGFFEYHLVIPAASWLYTPVSVSYIGRSDRVLTVNTGLQYNDTFTTAGWKDAEPYTFMKNGLEPEGNILWHVLQTGVYGGLPLSRSSVVESMLLSDLGSRETVATASAVARNLLDLTGTNVVISGIPVLSADLTPVTQLASGGRTLYIYRNPTANPRAYLVGNTKVVSTVAAAQSAFADPLFDARTSAVVEQPLTLDPGPDTARLTVDESADQTRLTVSVMGNRKRQLLVVTDTYYPGWSAALDGKPVPIIPVNVRNRGVVIPPGDHIIVFSYMPQSAAYGLAISIVTLMLIVGLGVGPHVISTAGIVLRARRHGRGRAGSPGTSPIRTGK